MKGNAMGLLETVQRGKQLAPPRIMLFGTEGIGKSFTSAQAPSPIFIQTEDGLGQIDCHKFPLAQAFDDVIQALGALYSEEHDYQTVVIDSLDWLERLIFDAVCRDYGAKSIEKVDGGYGRGYQHALARWREILDGLDALHRERRMIVILLAHAKVERYEDPETSGYDRHVPRLNRYAAALITEWSDIVAFATRRFRVESETTGFNRERGIAQPIGKDGGERILRTVGGPSCVAKNRYSLPAELPLDWTALFNGITSNTSSTN